MTFEHGGNGSNRHYGRSVHIQGLKRDPRETGKAYPNCVSPSKEMEKSSRH